MAVGNFVRGLQDKLYHLELGLRDWKETPAGYDIRVDVVSSTEGDSKAPDVLEDVAYTNVVHKRGRGNVGTYMCSQTLYAYLDVGTIVVHFLCRGTEIKYHTTATILSPRLSGT